MHHELYIYICVIFNHMELCCVIAFHDKHSNPYMIMESSIWTWHVNFNIGTLTDPWFHLDAYWLSHHDQDLPTGFRGCHPAAVPQVDPQCRRKASALSQRWSSRIRTYGMEWLVWRRLNSGLPLPTWIQEFNGASCLESSFPPSIWNSPCSGNAMPWKQGNQGWPAWSPRQSVLVRLLSWHGLNHGGQHI